MVHFESKPIPSSGVHTGVLFQFLDLGTHAELVKTKEPSGATKTETKMLHKLLFNFELPEELMVNGLPFAISARYNYFLSDNAKLVIDMKSWLGERIGRDFDFRKLLGKGANLNVVHNESKGNIYANIGNISPLKKTEIAPNPVNPLIYFDLEEFEEATLAKLPQFFQDMIKKSTEYQIIQKHGCGLREARLKEQEARNKLNPNAAHPAFDDGTPVE